MSRHAYQSLVQSISTLEVQSGLFHSTNHSTLLLKFVAWSHSVIRTKLSEDTPVPESSESPCNTFVTAAEFCHSKIKKQEDWKDFPLKHHSFYMSAVSLLIIHHGPATMEFSTIFVCDSVAYRYVYLNSGRGNGRTATLVRDHICPSINLNSPLQFITLHLNVPNLLFAIWSIYFPPTVLTAPAEITNLISYIPPTVFNLIHCSRNELHMTALQPWDSALYDLF
jgi:hypothetical protein